MPEAQSQAETNSIWNQIWKKDQHGSRKQVFSQRLFVEAYPVFKRYIPPDAKEILEVGAGSGRYGVAIARDFTQSGVTITDILHESLNIGRRLAKECGVTNIIFQKENALRLSFADNKFDLVFCDAMLQHIPEYKTALHELIRVLRPGGTLIVSSVNGWNLPHRLYRSWLRIRGKEYRYGFEKNFTSRELKKMLSDEHMQVVAQDGFYFAYGVYRWKTHHSLWKPIGGALNRGTKLLDALSFRLFSKYFGFEIFCVAQKPIGPTMYPK